MKKAMLPFLFYFGSTAGWGATGVPLPLSPDAELQRQQQQLEQQRRRLEPSAPDIRLDDPGWMAPPGFDQLPSDSPCFVIEQLHLVDMAGQPIAGFEWLHQFLTHEGEATLMGRCLGAQGVAWLIDRGQKQLVQRGLVTSRLLAAPQDMHSGQLKLTLILGRIRATRFEPETPPLSLLDWAFPMKSGDALNLRDIEQALENLKRVPTAEADIQIVPAEGEGAHVGESDLRVLHQQATPIRLNLSIDDSGTKATGKLLSSATLSLDNMLQANDLFYLTLNTDMGAGDPGPRGTHGKTAHYSLPIGYWTWGVTWNESRYAQQVAGLNGPYVYSGTSENTELKATRLVFRDAVQKINLSLAAFERKANNFVEDTEVLTQRRIEDGWVAGLNHKTFIGTSTLESNLNYKWGKAGFGALPSLADPSGWGTSQFGLTTADVNLSAPFNWGEQRFRYNGAIRAQTYETPLTPLNQFAIAGRYTVRGFDGENTLSGERGWLWRNDMSWALGDSGQEMYYALDHGEVGGRTSDLLVGKTLTGNAVGLRGGWRRINYDVFLAAPVRKPDHFKAPSYVAGFGLSLSF